MGVLGQFSMDVDTKKKVNEEVFFVAKLNAKFEEKMKEMVAEVATENTKKMSVIQEEIMASNAMQQAILAMLCCLTSTT